MLLSHASLIRQSNCCYVFSVITMGREEIYQKRVRVFHQVKQMKARGLRPRAFIVSKCLEVIYQKRVQVFHQGFQTPRNR